MNTDAVDATTRFCPVCLAEGRVQVSLLLTEITGGGLEPDGTEQEPFYEVYYRCANCGSVYYETE